MADPSSNPSNNPAPPGEGLSMERRFLIALILMGLILFLTQYLYKPAAPPPKSAAAGPDRTSGRGGDPGAA